MRHAVCALLLLSVLSIYSCNKDKAEKPSEGTVQVYSSADYKLSTGKIKNKSAEAIFMIWEAKGKSFDRFPNDFGNGYAYDSTSKKSYKNIYQSVGDRMETTLKPGRYFLFLILRDTPDDYDLPDFANSSTYFTVKSGEKTVLSKTFGPDTYSNEMTDWDD